MRTTDIREVLYTTRAMRRVRPDPVPPDVLARILDAAIRAPSGGNMQAWRFLVVDDPTVKAAIAPLYRDSIAQLWRTVYADRLAAAKSEPDSPDAREVLRMQASAQHLADHFEEVPLFLFAFGRMDPNGGSIFPAVWSAMLAASAEGVGRALTSVLGLFPEQDAERDRETELRERRQRQRPQYGEGAGEHETSGRDDATGGRQADDGAGLGAVLESLLADPRHQEDVVVDAERDEEHEDEKRQAVVRAAPAEDVVEEQCTDPERGRERQHHSANEHKRCDHCPQQPSEDDEHHQQHDRDDQVAVVVRRALDV